MKKSITRDEWSSLILFLAILLGAFMRFNPTMLAGFPINDGGMFAVMVDDLKTSGYALPAFTSYNYLNIPYAYPPLGFYLGRIAADLFGLDTVQVLRWLPAFFASLSIPAFYVLALRLLKNKYYAAASTLFFALMPRALSWFVMGGGLTRSPGQFFMLLTLASVVHLYQHNRRLDVFLAGIFGGLAVLSHPEAAVHTFVSAIFLWLMLSRTLASFFQSVAVGLVVLVVTAPWWATVLYYHGIEPLILGAQTGQNTLAIFHLVFFTFTEEPYATVIAVLGLLGIGYSLIRREYLLTLWMIIPFFVEGRSAPGPASIPLAMLAAIGLVDVVLAGIQRGMGEVPQHAETLPAADRNILMIVVAYLIFSTYQFGFHLSNATLYLEDRQAMLWARDHTPQDSRFLVLTGTTSVSCDSVLEWFPALAGRQSIYTVQGREWTEGGSFNAYVRSTYDVQQCLSEGNVSCLDQTTERSEYDFVYISKSLLVNNCSPLEVPRTFPHFVEALRTDDSYITVYETEGAIIYELR